MSRALDKEIIDAIGNISVVSASDTNASLPPRAPNASDITDQVQHGRVFWMAGPFSGFSSTIFRPMAHIVNPAGSGKNLIIFSAQLAVTGGGGAAVRGFKAATGHSSMSTMTISNALFTGGEVGTFSAYRTGATSAFSEGDRLTLHFIDNAGGVVEIINPAAPLILTPGDEYTIGGYPESASAIKMGATVGLVQVDP